MQLAAQDAVAHGDVSRDRDPSAVQHEVHQGIELVAHQHGLEDQSFLTAGNVEELAHGVFRVGQGDGVRLQLLQAQVLVCAEGMVFAHERVDR